MALLPFNLGVPEIPKTFIFKPSSFYLYIQQAAPISKNLGEPASGGRTFYAVLGDRVPFSVE